MTEINETTIKLPETANEFILRWGDMGSQWGVNRSVAQIHALLFLSEEPMNAEEISEVLGIARSNVSNSLKELLNWRLIERTPIHNDRRDHFIAIADVMTMFRLIVRGRMEREINPAIDTLARCVEKSKNDDDLSPQARKRLHDMHSFVSGANSFYLQMQDVPNGTLHTIMKMGASVLKYIPGRK